MQKVRSSDFNLNSNLRNRYWDMLYAPAFGRGEHTPLKASTHTKNTRRRGETSTGSVLYLLTQDENQSSHQIEMIAIKVK